MIGGLKEKFLAAHRAGIKRVIIPEENLKDLEEVPNESKEGIEIHTVVNAETVLSLALTHPLQPLITHPAAPEGK